MITTVLTAGAINAVLATLLAAVVLAATWAWRNPFVARGMWLAILLRFLAPPLVLLPVIQVATTPPSESEIATTPVVSQPESLLPTAAPPAPSPPATIAESADSAQQPTPVRAPRAIVPTMPAMEPRAIVTPQQSVALVWLAGSLAFACVGAWRIARFHAAVRGAVPATPPLQRRAAEIATGLAIRRLPHVRLTAGRTPPLVWPLGRRATVLLPAALVESLDDDQLSAILAHELTHLRRRDAWTRWLELAVVVAFWWCPTAWLARRRLQDAEERCCDADALAAFPRWRRAYADALLATIEFLSPPAPRGLLATPMARRGALYGRFQMLTTQQLPERPRRKVRWLVAAVAVMALLVSPAAVAEPEASDAEASPATTAAQEPEGEASAPPNETSLRPGPITLEMPDGRTLTARIALVDNAWVVTADEANAELPTDRELARLRLSSDWLATAVASTDTAAPDSGPASLSEFGKTQLWDLTLAECIATALMNTGALSFDVIRDGDRCIVRFHSQDHGDLEAGIANWAGAVANAYWELWFAYQSLDVIKSSRDESLDLWRRVKELERAGQIVAQSEPQARTQYYSCRAQIETAMSDVLGAENRLRSALGVAPADGRLIRPVDTPPQEPVAIDAEQAQRDALANDRELRRHRESIVAQEKRIEQFKDMSDADWQRFSGAIIKETTRVMQELELEVRRQLADAIRDVDLSFAKMEANIARTEAERNEVAAELADVNELFSVGQNELHRVLEAQSRLATAAQQASRSRADYACALMRLYHRTGALLAYYNIEIADATKSN